MFIYSNKTEHYADNLIVFSADAVAEVEEDEMLAVSVPTIWDDHILSSININEYDIYYICTHLCRTGQYNKITDYKKIWKLEGIPVGIMDGFYDTKEGRVYWGIYKACGNKGFRIHLSSTMVLSLQSSPPLDLNYLYKLWKKYQLIPDKAIPVQLFNELGLMANHSYVLHYSSILSYPSLQIYGHNASSIFPLEKQLSNS